MAPADVLHIPLPPRDPQPPYPLDPLLSPLLDPEYKAFYNTNLKFKQQVQHQSIGISRSGAPVQGAGPLQPVNATRDLLIPRTASSGPEIPIRVFYPPGSRPASGWPVMLWFHGGGWVLGGIDTENVVCTHLCRRSGAVVVTVDYRLATEHPYPAAVHDAWEAALYLFHRAPQELGIDRSAVAIGGSSAGGNLALIVTQRALSPEHVLPSPFRLLLLSVPVTDNTATPSTNESWAAFENTPGLPAEKMRWYRDKYLPDVERRCDPEASPSMWDGDWGALPRTIVLVGELDVLREEGENAAKKIKEAGGASRLEIMAGCPHPFIAMDGVLEKGKEAIDIFCEELAVAFGKPGAGAKVV